MALSLGKRLGQYEISGALGAGGMGEVYRAHDTTLGRDVALKILPESFVHDSDRLARFKREAQVLASLNHPNIAAIYGFEAGDGVQSLVLELVDGPTLAERIAQGPIPIEDALPIARQIAEALEAAHEQGIIHRDLKPANIKIRADGTVKVLDFGLAKATEAATGTSLDLANSPTLTSPAMMTSVGIILGTAAYMSPEQARGRTVDKRADIWAFGCVLFEMLTGRRAFEGDDISTTVAAVLKTDPDWQALPSTIPAALRRLLMRCLKKDPKDRLQAIGDARIEIGELLVGVTDPARVAIVPRVAGWRRPTTLAAAVLGLLMGSVITGAVVVRSLARTTAPVTRWLHTLDEGQQFTNSGRNVVSVSPDGLQIVYVANQHLYLRSMAELDARLIRGAQGISNAPVVNPVFSPDSRWIVFFSDNWLKKIAATGGTAIPLCEARNPYGIGWDQQDTIVFGQRGTGILRVPADGGTPEVVARVKDTEVAEGPQLLPGGQAVLFTVASGDAFDRWDHAQIVVQSLKSGERTTLVNGGSEGRYVPTGHLVYAVGGSLLAVPFDVTQLKVKGGPTSVIEGVQRAAFGQTGAAHFSVSATGTLIYVPGPPGAGRLQMKLAWIDRQGHVEPLPLPVAPYEHPRIAPDGRHIAYDIDNGKDANVWTYDLSGTSAPQPLTSGGRNTVPVWSPDSSHVAFQSDREGDAAIFWQRADGTDTAVRLTRPEHGTSHVPVSWSDNTLLFDVTAGSDTSLWSLSLLDRKAAPFDAVHSRVPTAAAFSPDGRWVAYTLYQGGFLPLYVQPFPPTGPPHKIVAQGVHPLWSQDGELFFNPEQFEFAVVRVWTHPTFGFSNPVPVPKAGADDGGPLRERNNDIAPDGKRFLVVVPNVVSQTTGSMTSSTASQIKVVENWFEELKRLVPTK